MALDYIGIAQGRLTNQFSDSPLLTAVTGDMVAPLVEVEQDCDDLRAKRWIETAEGKQLDGCGEIVGEPRSGRDDETYREALRFRVFINVSKGTPPDIIHALDYVTQADSVQYMESYPATVMLYTDGYAASVSLPNVMQDLLPAGVSDVDIAVSYGEEALRVSGIGFDDDESSELAGFAASVFHCIDGRRLRTLSNKRIRIRSGYVVHKTKPTICGLFEKR